MTTLCPHCQAVNNTADLPKSKDAILSYTCWRCSNTFVPTSVVTQEPVFVAANIPAESSVVEGGQK